MNKPKQRAPYYFRGQAQYSRKRLVRKLRKVTRKVNELCASTIRQSQVNNAFATITQAGVYTLLNGMAVGDGDNNRNGNSIVIKRLECRCAVTLDGLALSAPTVTNYWYRMMIIYDTQPDNAVFSIQDVLQNSGTNANNYLSTYDVNNVIMKLGDNKNHGRFRILYDKTFHIFPQANTQVAAGNTTAYESNSKYIVVKKNFKKGLLTKYDNSNIGTIVDINTGSLYMYETCSANANLTGANRCQIVYYE